MVVWETNPVVSDENESTVVGCSEEVDHSVIGIEVVCETDSDVVTESLVD